MRGILLLALALVLGGCEREQRQLRVPPAGAASFQPERTRYDENAYAIGQGKLLFRWFNCAGCHAHGGGGMGPALMDDQWRYGKEPQSIYTTIMEGRPNGMPAFRGRISEQQVWQLVAYVRSMSGLVAMDAAPGRSDSLHPASPEVLRDER